MTNRYQPGSMKRALVAVITAVGIGCSPAPVPSATPILFHGRLPADPGPDIGGRALQEAIFADGKVTFDEYERAFSAAIQCMRDEGFDVEGPLRYPDGYVPVMPGFDPRLKLTLNAHVGEDAEDRFGEVNARCQAQWSYAVEWVFLHQFAPTEEEIQRWLERAWACAREHGLPVSDPPTVEEAIRAVPPCEPWEGD